MKLYLASSFSLTDRVEQVAAALEAEGHEIAVRWWDRTFNVEGEGQVHTQVLKKRYNDMPPDAFYARPECEYAFLTDMQGIQESGALVMVATDEPRDYAGASVEIGYAIGVGRPVFLLGRLKNSAMYWPLCRCKDLPDLLSRLRLGAPLIGEILR